MAAKVKIPDRGYCIGTARTESYSACFKRKSTARKAAQRLANRTHERVDLVKVQNRGEDRFIVDEVEPRRG